MVWKPNVTVAAVIERAGRFLFVEERIRDALVLNQPAGHLERGETLEQAVIRETLEETAYSFTPVGLIGIYRWPHPERDLTYLRFAFHGPVSGPEPGRALDTGVVRALWLSPDELAAESTRHRSPQVALCVEHYLQGQRFPLTLLHDVALTTSSPPCA
ncbi:MAG TPA: NUDIX hydrolase [Acidiferrobacteraceae bacterium]|nr:NUDIX hydrolase [Acidiferrobacteraceae bacterium]